MLSKSLFTSILSSYRVVKKIDGSQARIQVFEDLKSRKKIYKFLHWFYDLNNANFLGTLLAGSYGLKSFLNVKLMSNQKGSVLTVAGYTNEIKTIQEIKEIVGNENFCDIKLSILYLFHYKSWYDLFTNLKAIPKFLRIVKYIKKTCHFIPALRAASLFGYYLRFKLILRKNSHIKAVMVASNYSPEALSLSTAARELNIRVIYTNHSYIPSNMGYVPPVLADLSILSGEIVYHCYKDNSSIEGRVLYKGLMQKSITIDFIALKESEPVVGIFLTAPINIEVLEELVSKVNIDLKPKEILIRQHPVEVVKRDLSFIQKVYDNIIFSKDRTLQDDINACNFVIVGNSSVVMEILNAGKVVIYKKDLDGYGYDYVGFVKNKLIPDLDYIGFNNSTIKNFYKSEEWNKNIKKYNPNYLDEDRKKQSIANIRNCIIELCN